MLIVAGIGSLALSDRDRPPLIVGGILATILGCLLLGPAAIRVFSRLAGRASIAPRLALRDLVRYQARSGAALAAVALALGIAATAVIVTAAEEAKQAAEPPNLSDRQIRVHIGPPKAREAIPAEALRPLDRQAAGVAQLAAGFDGAAVIPLEKVIDSRCRPSSTRRRHPRASLGRARAQASGTLYTPGAQLFVATPAVLRYLGIDPATVDPGADFLADRSVPVRRLVLPKFTDRGDLALTNVQSIEVGRPARLSRLDGRPEARVHHPGGLRRHGYRQIPAGWVVETRRPLTSEQIADARSLAASAGLTLEVRNEEPSFATAMALTTAAGALLALGILALTVGLIRGESGVTCARWPRQEPPRASAAR